MKNPTTTSSSASSLETGHERAWLSRAAGKAFQTIEQILPLLAVGFFRKSTNGEPRLMAATGDGLPDTFAPENIPPGLFCFDLIYENLLWGYAAILPDAKSPQINHQMISNIVQPIFESGMALMELDALKATGKRNIERMAAIYDIGQAIHRLEGDELLDFVCQRTAEVMDAQACSLLLKNSQNELFIRAQTGLPDSVATNTRIERGHGIAWHVAITGEARILNDGDSGQVGDVELPVRMDIQSSMLVPLKTPEGRISGVICIRRMAPSPRFTEEDLQAFTIVGGQVSLAIANADLHHRLSRRVTEMATVNRLTAAINSTLDLEFVLSQIADCIIDIVGFDRCILYLSDYRKGLESRIVRGYSEDESYPSVIEANDGVVGLAAREQVVIFAEGERLATASQVSDPKSAGGNAVIAAPIVVRKQTIGVIVADNQNTGRNVEAGQVELLSTFVNHAGLAIENSRLYEAMEQKYAELNVLYDMSRTIGSAFGLDNAVELLFDVALKAVPYESSAFALVNESTGDLSIHATRQLDPILPKPWQIAEEAGCRDLLKDLRDRKSILPPSPDIQMDAWQKAFKDVLGMHTALLFMPLIAEGKLLGHLMMARDAESGFDSNDVKLLSIIVSHASTVVKNAVTYEQSVREKVLELSALYEISQRISSARTLTEALDNILAIVSDMVDSDECMIWTLDQETSKLELRASLWSDRTGQADREHPRVDEDLALWALKEQKAIVLPDILQDTRFSTTGLRESRVRSLMSIPLLVQDEVVGVLTVHNYTPNSYTEDQVRILSVVASQAASIYRGLEALTALTSYTDNILTSLAAGVVTLGSEGRIVSWNRAADEILHLEDKAALSLAFGDLLDMLVIPETDRELLDEAISKVENDGQSEMGLQISAAAGEEDIHLMLNISRLQDNQEQPLGLVIIIEDVTRQVHMQEEVRRMGELAAIGQLAASIAHELRNPLSSIKGAAQFLQTESEDPGTKEFLSIIVEEVDGLNKIASDFLDFARPLKIDAKEVNLRDVLQKQQSLLGPQLSECSVTMSLQIDDRNCTLVADQKHVEQVLLNLILNSLQAMQKQGELTIAVKPSSKWEGHLELSVRDTGSGIPPERISKIFTPFFTTKTKGTGLGLPVVQKIVQNHQGHIEVDSREGEGTIFRIHLPVAGPRQPLLSDLPESPDLLERSSS